MGAELGSLPGLGALPPRWDSIWDHSPCCCSWRCSWHFH